MVIMIYTYFHLLTEAYGNCLDIKILSKQNREFILLISLEHRDVFYVIVHCYVLLYKFEAGIQKASPRQRVDLLNRVEVLVVGFSVFDPVQKQRVMEHFDGWRHQDVGVAIREVALSVVEVPFEVRARLCDRHFLLAASRLDKAGVLLEEHDRVEQVLLFCCFVDEVVLGLENRV